GIEIKADSAPGPDAARHLRWLRDAIGNRFALGLVLHTGPRSFRLDESIAALPICALWGLLAGGVLLRRAGEVGAGVEDGTHPAPRLFSLGRDVLGGPVSLVRAVALEHPAGHGGLVYLVDA